MTYSLFVEPSKIQKSDVAVAGHNGVGHGVSHSGFTQDDSLGFAMLAKILARAAKLDLSVYAISFEGKKIIVDVGTAENKGRGEAESGIVITPFEKENMQRAVGKSALIPQNLTNIVFGRSYGHGATEVASIFNFALSRAVLNLIQKNWPETEYAIDNIPESLGEFLGGTILIDGISVQWLLTINCCVNGSGPNEDSEGIVPVGNKGHLMQKLNMLTIPTIILESRAFVPALKEKVEVEKYFVRWNDALDNDVVAECLIKALKHFELPHMFDSKAYPRDAGLINETKRIGTQLEGIAKSYAIAKTSREKVDLAYKIAKLANCDLGGSIFMSNDIFANAGAGGLWPGKAAVFSSLITEENILKNGIVITEEKEVEEASDVVLYALVELEKHKHTAQKILDERFVDISPDKLLEMTK